MAWRTNRLDLGRAARVVAVALLAAASGCLFREVDPRAGMVKLDGRDPAFAVGRKTFARPRSRCLDAVAATFGNTGHGVEQRDPAAGTIVSGKAVVYSGTTSTSTGTAEVKVSNKFYVQVSGGDAECEVVVTRLRAWRGTLEVETRTWTWTVAHLGAFIRGVEQELGEPAVAGAPAAQERR